MTDAELIPELNTARFGEARKRRNLFIARYLKADADNYQLRGAEQDRAYRILCKWADLEAKGTLGRRKESNLEAEFLTEVFGQALGYTLFSEGLAHWNIEPKLAVEGIGIVDAAIGQFEAACKHPPRAMVELKGPTVNVDRDRSQGRTPVQQCWDYLNAVPDCSWGIVCNLVSFRLYHKSLGSRAYQIFTLKDLKDPEIFRQFYFLLERGGLLPLTAGQKPRADALLERTSARQREVGDELYSYYHDNRVALVQHLRKPPHAKPLDKAIFITQRLLDRVIFVAFCEDRGLLPEKVIQKACTQLPPFYRVTNPRWQNFLNLFQTVDKGSHDGRINGFNGGLFAVHDDVDNLQLEDDWTGIFNTLAGYDFRDEVNVDVLGHLFERSINDLERMRLSGLFPGSGDQPVPKMAKSAERKKMGVYYTPPAFTEFIVHNTVVRLARERFAAHAEATKLSDADLATTTPAPTQAQYWRGCLDVLRRLKIVDPACGSGAFLIQAYDALEELYLEALDHLAFHEGSKAEPLREQVPDYILHDNLFGVDLSPEAVEITQLALWIRSARTGRTLANLSDNIVCGNSLVRDKAVHERALTWRETFRAVYERPEGGFDCVIGNPPWERMKLQEREFFDLVEPDIAAAVDAATRRRMIAELEQKNPELNQRYLAAKATAEKTLAYVRSCDGFPLTGKGDINTYAVFAELACCLVAAEGVVGLLVPSGIATDHTTKEFFGRLVDDHALFGLYDFENRHKVFPDVDGRFKFSVLLFGGAQRKAKEADFVFFAHEMDDLKPRSRHIKLSAADLKLLNPNTRTCPIFRSRRDAEITKAVYRRVPVLVDHGRKSGGNPWGVKQLRMLDQTNDAELFRTAEQLAAEKAVRAGAYWKKGKKRFLPLYEAKMVQVFDHRAASVVVKAENWMRQGQTAETSLVDHQNPEHWAEPRWWVDEASIASAIGNPRPYFLGFKDITSATNQRTMIAAAIPWSAVTNHFVLALTEQKALSECCLLANLNSYALDYVARQKTGGVTLNFFIVEQLPVLPPDVYAGKCPWDKKHTLEDWIAQRVLKLTCTSNDMIPLAKAAAFKPPVHKWQPEERADLMAELDAAYFLLYGIERDDAQYILSTFSGASEPEAELLSTGSAFSRILAHYDRLRT